ncbi:MAG: hypothetical protein FJ090_21455 [Deltaproteobacteria bacterium]|nr:hypothetical protein [Deltaproteobacteria bacterium]
MLPLLACTTSPPGDTAPAADTDTGGASDTDTAGDTASDTAPEGLAVALLLADRPGLVDAVEAADGSLIVADAGGTWAVDGTEITKLYDAPGQLSPGTATGAFLSPGGDIVSLPAGTPIEGTGAYAPAGLDVLATEQGDRLTFPGADPGSGAFGTYTARADGGPVPLVGEGYTGAQRWIFRPEGETVWSTSTSGELWLVAEGEDVATLVASGVPTGGLTGSLDGATLYLGGGNALWTYDVVNATLTEHPLQLDADVLSVHRTTDGLGGILTTATAVYRVSWP